MMRQLTQHLNAGEKTELNVQKKKEVEYVLEGTIKPQKGQIVWEISVKSVDQGITTLTVVPAEYKNTTASFNRLSNIDSSKLITKSNCIYIPATNKENAIRKYGNNKDQAHYYAPVPAGNINDLKN